MKSPLISVVIPIYNTEKYLEKCLDSIVNQTYKNLEIICINDGSTDSSPEIITKYANKDSRIKIINQKNSILIISLCINIFNMSNQLCIR